MGWEVVCGLFMCDKIHMAAPRWQFTNIVPNYDSIPLARTFCIVFHYKLMVLFSGGFFSGIFPRSSHYALR